MSLWLLWLLGLLGLLGLAALVVVMVGLLASRLHRLQAQLYAVQSELRKLYAVRSEQLPALRAELRELAGQLEQRLAALPAALDRPPAAADLPRQVSALPRRVYARVEAYADLRALIRPRAPMPPLDDWALDADVLHLVASLLWQRRPGLVVECGSGSSSVWLGYLVELLGTGRVVSLEHADRYRQRTRELLQEHRLAELVEVRAAPLQEWTDRSGAGYQWYATEALADLTGIGLLLVDGPPGNLGEQARYPAGPLLLPRCAGDAVVVLDDTNRPGEQAVSDRWLAEWPGLAREVHCQSRAHAFTWTADPATGRSVDPS